MVESKVGPTDEPTAAKRVVQKELWRVVRKADPMAYPMAVQSVDRKVVHWGL